MIIKFENVVIHNFMSLGDVEVKLDNQGYTLISGVNNNPTDMASSNGSGKSSIFSAISYALTGETLNGLSRNLTNIHTDDGMYVKLYFKVDSDDFVLIRSKDHKELGTNLKIIINGQDKSGKGIRDSEKLLAEYLPDLTSSLLSSVIILGQGMPQRFSDNTPSGRKEILEKLTKSDFMIEDIKKRVADRKDLLSKQLRTIEDKSIELATTKRSYQNNIDQIKVNLESFSNKPDFDSQIFDLETKIQQTNDELQIINNTKTQLSDDINNLTNIIFDLDNQLKSEIQSVNKDLKESLELRKQNLSELEVEDRSLKSKIKQYEAVVDVCPTCGQKLPDVHKIDTTDLHAQESDLLESLNQLREVINNQKILIDNNESEITIKYRDRKSVYFNDINTKKTQLSENNNQENTTARRLRDLSIQLTSVKMNKDNFDGKVNQLKSDLVKYEEDVKNIEDNILYNTNEKELLSNKLSIINKISTIATRDFRGFLLSNIISFINNQAKSYAFDVFGNDKINFELDGNNISISFDNKPIENLSGGERQKIDLIVQFAIRDMLCQYMNFSSNILVIDEAFDFLDFIGCQKVVDMISRKLCDVESVFIISHHKDLSLPVDNELTIIKNEQGISRLSDAV